MPAWDRESVTRAEWLVMGLIVALTCVLSWASGAFATPASSSLAGRWSGAIYGIKGDPARCADGSCTLTVDVVPCGKAWCGIEVRNKGTSCGGVALRLEETPKGSGDDWIEHRGRLELAKGTESFAVQLVYRPARSEAAPSLHLIGNTGPELMLFRRSFPLEADLSREGDAVCKLESTTS